MRTMYDSTDPSQLPTGGDLYAGYIDGNYQSYNGIVSRFGASKSVPIAVFASTNGGTVGDVESGDMTPSNCVGWVSMRRTAGVDPTIYCSLSLWPAVQQAFIAANIPQPHYWIAAYPGNGANLYAGAVAHQYASQSGYDTSVVADSWPGVDPGAGPSPTPASTAATNSQTPGTPAPPNPDYGAQLTSYFMGRHATPTKPSRVCTATVISGTDAVVIVNLDNFGADDGTATYSARYENRLNSKPNIPPNGTRCVVVFPENESDYSPWAITFVGWP